MRILCLLLALALPTLADQVVLKSGVALEGEILAEDEFEVRIETSRTSDGAVRTVRIIDRDAVESLARTTPTQRIEPVRGSAPEPEEDLEDGGLDLDEIDLYLQKGDGLLTKGKYDKAIQRYKRVATHKPLIELQKEDLSRTGEILGLRERAYKLWMVALQGKVDYLEEQQEQSENEVDSALKLAEKRLKEYEASKKSDSKRKVVTLRSRQKQDALTGTTGEQRKDAVRKARNNVRRFEQWAQENELKIQNLKSEIDFLKEKARQLAKESKKLD